MGNFHPMPKLLVYKHPNKVYELAIQDANAWLIRPRYHNLLHVSYYRHHQLKIQLDSSNCL